MAAYALTRAGADVALLEAGGVWTPPDRGGIADPAAAEALAGAPNGGTGGWSLDGEPFTTGPGTSFEWWRARALGGRTNAWGRVAVRMGPDDFRRRSLDGLGDDWPIGYDDLHPYYDRLDRLIGLFGSAEGLRDHPDGIFHPPPPPRCWEVMVREACARQGIACIPNRMTVLTRPHGGRPACGRCGRCNRDTCGGASFAAPGVLIAPALATGRLSLTLGAMAREVTVGRDGRATGVTYVNRQDGSEGHVRGRVVVLAASACESARLLLNSHSPLFPHGLANGSGTVGRYLTDTPGIELAGLVPRMMDRMRHDEGGTGTGHLYMPGWLDHAALDFPRGYHVEMAGGLEVPSVPFMPGIHRYPGGGGYGRRLKDDYRRWFGATIRFSARGEMIPNDQSYCEIDPHIVDRWGIPVLRFRWRWSEHEVNQVHHMQRTIRSLIAEMGGEPLQPMPGRDQAYGIAVGGHGIHELGCTRMGTDPESSVVGADCRAHEVPNLYVADGGPFVSQPEKNPTWTLMALAWRTSDRILAHRRAGEA